MVKEVAVGTETEQKRLLRVGVDDALPVPMQMGDPASDTFRGYEVDLLRLLAGRLHWAIEYHRARWSLITSELSSGRLDLICSAATVTERRKTEVNFCTPHLRLRLALVVGENAPNPLDAAVSRFGVRRGTTAEEFLREGLGLQPVMLSESNEDLYHAVSNGQLDAIIDDSPIATHFASSIAGLSYRGVYESTDGEYAIMVRRENDALKCEIDAALSVLETEGILAMLRERWFGTPAALIV
jgi:ABC-type amino acid transport substrate-binding protein